MNKYYKLLCNPFRLEINNIVNNHLDRVQLTIKDTEPTFRNSSSTVTIHDSTLTTPDIEVEMEVTGLAPTHSSVKSDTFGPASDTDLSNNVEYELYICNLCPII